MSDHTPPAHPVWILAKYGARRTLNRMSGQMSAMFRKKDKQEPGRTATPRKSRKGWIILLVILLSFFWSALTTSSHLVNRLSEAIKGVQSHSADAAPAEPAFLPSPDNWPADRTPAMLRACGLAFGIGVATVFFLSLTGALSGAGQAEGSNQWLFTFPVRARTLFLAKALERALLNGYTYVFLMPLLVAILWTAGLGWYALPLALAFGACINLLIAVTLVLLETWLRLAVRPERLKDIQAFCGLAGGLGIALLVLLAQGTFPVDWFTHMAGSLPETVLWLPVMSPVMACLGGLAAWLALASAAGAAAATVFGAICLAQWLVRKGMVAEPGPHHGKRGAIVESRSGWRVALGMAGKEAKMLLRDRNRLAGVLIVPLLLIGLNVLTRSGTIESLRQSFTSVSVLAFIVGAYVMLTGAFRVLADEQKSLWLLYTLPRPLHILFLRKVRVWIAAGLVYPVAILAAAAVINPQWSLSNLADAGVALVGVVIFAFVAAGLGFLGTDPLESNPQRAQKLSYVYLYMMLAAMYLPAISSASVSFRVGQMVFSALLAVAIWQKVRDSIPYLLDPTQAPPPRIGTSDGLIAAFAFLSIQSGVLSMFAQGAPSEVSPGLQLLIAYLVAGVLVALGSLVFFQRRRVPDLAKSLGIRRGDESVSRKVSLAAGIAGGLAASALGVGYLWLIGTAGPLRACVQDSLRLSVGGNPGPWLIGLMVVAAPLLEEYVFRGLLLKGLLQTLPQWAAIVASAAMFALVHPPISVVPVFFLGIETALVYARTRWLLPAILVHAIYNAAILAAQPLLM